MSTFGDLNIEGSWINLSTGYQEGTKFTLSEAGTINSITVYIGKDSGSGNYTCALYDSGGTLRGYTASVALSGSYDWYTNNLVTPYAAAAADYALVVWSNGTAVYSKYNGAAGTLWGCTSPPTFPNWDASWGGVPATGRVSIYATYTTGGGDVTCALVGVSG